MSFLRFLLNIILQIAQLVVICIPVAAFPKPGEPQCIDSINIEDNCYTPEDRPYDCAVDSDGTIHMIWVNNNRVYRISLPHTVNKEHKKVFIARVFLHE
jgi:hypothetical protein